jgi:alkylation response protein AidB-like acyl-CoA dehydrogenase
MYDLHLTAEQLEIRDTVRSFVEGEIKPVVLNPERLQSGDRGVQIELVSKAARIGLRTLALSEESGGAGADSLTSCIVMEELGAGDANVASVLAQTSTLGALLFDRLMTAEQRKRFLPRFLDDDRYHLACAVPEADPEAAWKYHRTRAHGTSAGGLTAARGSSGDWMINGTAPFVANAPIAQLFAVQARTEASRSGVATLLVPRDTTGLVVSDANAASGDSGGTPNVKWYHGVGGPLTFKDCRVPAENALPEDRENRLASIGETSSMPQWAAINLGIGRAAYEAAVDYAKLRVQGARPIIQHQAIGTILAEIAIKLAVARAAIWQAAWASDHPDACADRSLSDLPLHIIAKVYTSEAMHKATERAAECFGAMGVMLDMPLPKYVHDARVFLQAGLSNSVAKLQIAEAVAGYQQPSVATVGGGSVGFGETRKKTRKNVVRGSEGGRRWLHFGGSRRH